MIPVKIKSLLGLGQKARKLVTGQRSVQGLLAKRHCWLVLLAEDAPPKYIDYYQRQGVAGTPVWQLGTKVEWGAALGQSPRVVIGVTDQQLAKAVVQALIEAKSPTGEGVGKNLGGV